MKLFRIIGLCLVAAFAFSAVAASAASAANPEFKKPFPKLFISLGGTAKLKVKESLTVTCETVMNMGEITAAKKGTVIVGFLGCKAAGVYPCQSAGANAEEIVTYALKMTLGYIKAAAPTEVGVALEPEAGKSEPLAEFTCAIGTGESIVVKGSVIGKLTPLNTETTEFPLAFTEVAEEQVPQNLEGKGKDTLEASINGSVFYQATEVTNDTVMTEELTEVKA